MCSTPIEANSSDNSDRFEMLVPVTPDGAVPRHVTDARKMGSQDG